MKRLAWFSATLAVCASAACNREERSTGGLSSANAPAAAASSVAAAGSDRAPSAGSAPAAAPKPPGPLNVILLTVDSLRADEVPWSGYSRDTAPNLAKLAAESVVYDNAYSLSSYTAKSVAGFLTGRYPSTLYRDGYFFTKYFDSNRFLAELLSEHGIKTIGWHGHLYFGRGKGLDQGFSSWELVPGITFDPETDNDVTSDKMTKLGIELLGKAENTQGPFFAWAHYLDPHDQYKKHPESPDFGRKGRDNYDSEIFFTDLYLAKFLEFAKAQPWWKNTAVIVSADHGEAFGEHGMYKHAFELWQVLVRVPLLVYAPGITPRHISERRSHVDLAPTIVELMGQPQADSFMGKSFVPELYGAAPDDREPIICELTEDSHNPQRSALIQGDYKLIVVGQMRSLMLFNLKNDPGELTDLAKTEPEKLAELKALFEKRYASIPSVLPAGGNKLHDGNVARGPIGPPQK